MQHGERYHEARCLQWRGFWLLEKLDLQLSLEPRSCHLGDHEQEAYFIPTMIENATQGELQRYKNIYRALNLITTALGRNVYDHVSHLKTAHNV
jgi:hypothetical protein